MSSLYLKSRKLSPITRSTELRRGSGQSHCDECFGRLFFGETIHKTKNKLWICQPCAELRDNE